MLWSCSVTCVAVPGDSSVFPYSEVQRLGQMWCCWSTICHLLTGQRKCHPMRDLTLNQQEQTRIQVLNSVLEYGLPIAQASEIMGLSQRHTKRLLAAYRRDGPAALAHGKPGTEAPQRRPRGRRGRSGGVGRRTLRRRQRYSPYRTAQRARGHRPEPSHGAPHPDQGRHGQPAQSSLSAAPVPEAAHAPEGHAGTGRWQSPPLARRAGAGSLCCCWRWTTPPVLWPRRSSAPRKTPEATWCSLRASSDSGESRWPCTATDIRPSSTTSVWHS